MYLAYKDVAKLIPDIRGGVEEDFLFYTVSDNASAPQPKGIFVPLSEQSGELKEALANGAIAAIWNKNRSVPRYTPTQFPLFLTDDPEEVVQNLLKLYLEKLDGETEEKMEITKFDFLTRKFLNKNNETYDIAGFLIKIDQLERRG